MRYLKETYKPGRVLHFSTQAYTYETIWSSTKSRKIELQSYLMYIKAYLKKQKSYAQTQCKLHLMHIHKAKPNTKYRCKLYILRTTFRCRVQMQTAQQLLKCSNIMQSAYPQNSTQLGIRIPSSIKNTFESAPTSCKAHILKIEDSWTSAFHLKLKAPFQLKEKSATTSS